MRDQLKVDWSRDHEASDIEPALGRYKRFLEGIGFSEQTIESYVRRVRKYLEFVKNDQPSVEEFDQFRDCLLAKRLSRNTLNNYGFAAKKYHEMIRNPVKFAYLKPDDLIPHYFNNDDIARIFDVCRNLKHYCMLMVMFYGALRASEICRLNDEDLDFEARTIRLRHTKGKREAIVPINEKIIQILRDYLKVRPSVIVDNEKPLFFTDFLRRWNRMDVYRMFIKYKKLARINKPGGIHVFGRHSPASIMVKNGCDIMTVKEIMRHKDIKTTVRYLHIDDKTKREKYEKFLVI
ncbi:MAG: site-specific integrase [Methanotrichaceae archaeon]|nr:site-specific integrase [Methanotrichaceae archaeon]